MPILGIMASQISGHLFAPSGAYDSIATTTVGVGGASTVTFSSIPSTYKHLQIRCNWAATTAAYLEDATFYFNSDTTGTNYRSHRLAGVGTSASSGSVQSTGYFIYPGEIPGTLYPNVFASTVIDIMDYANTNKNKTVKTILGFEANDSGRINLSSGLWMNTSAINSITFKIPFTYSIAQNSTFALYGIKGD